MGIAKSQFNQILSDIFKEGNVIRLFTTTPDEDTELGGVTLTGTGVVDYEIKAGDFAVSSGVVTSNRNMMFFLYEDTGATCQGFGVYNKSGQMLYFGDFDGGVLQLEYDDVPAIKKYNADKNEGIRITMRSQEVSATTT